MRRSNTPPCLRVLVALAASLAASASPSPAAEPPQRSADAPTRAFELRVYTAAPGKIDALHKRFRDHTLRLFKKHGITSVGYWVSEDDAGTARLHYLIAYPDRQSRERMLVKGIAIDPEFRRVVEESQRDGELVTEVESVLLTPTDYSPLQ